MTETQFIVEPGGALRGRLRVTGDKSISHRAIMLGALAEGVTEISGFLEGEDCLRTLTAFRAMGVRIEGSDHDRATHGRVTVHGVGLHGLRAPAEPLEMGNSGTAMRLLAGILSGQPFTSTLTGDVSLSQRPMRRITEPLARMGAHIEASANSMPPLTIRGGARLHGIDYRLPMASAQVKSCLLLAGLYAEGETAVTEPAPTRDHTERMLTGFGYPLECGAGRVRLRGGGRLRGGRIEIPGDISSAAFFLVGASIAPNSELLLERVGINPTRTGVIEILRRMGADIEIVNQHEIGGEPTADLRVRHASLHGIRIPESLVPLAIDEFPALFVAAACAEGETVLSGAGELRAKESDRIQVMADGLIALGIEARPTADGIVIRGGRFEGLATLQTRHDHRIAMSFAMAALRAEHPLIIREAEYVDTSFPGFVTLAASVGLGIRVRKA